MSVQAAPKLFFQQLLSLHVLDVFDYVADALELLSLFIGNFMAEFFFECHDQFHGIERIGAQIFDELGVGRHLIGVYTQLFDDDVFNSLFNAFISHGFLRFYFCSVSMPRWRTRQARIRKFFYMTMPPSTARTCP